MGIENTPKLQQTHTQTHTMTPARTHTYIIHTYTQWRNIKYLCTPVYECINWAHRDIHTHICMYVPLCFLDRFTLTASTRAQVLSEKVTDQGWLSELDRRVQMQEWITCLGLCEVPFSLCSQNSSTLLMSVCLLLCSQNALIRLIICTQSVHARVYVLGTLLTHSMPSSSAHLAQEVRTESVHAYTDACACAYTCTHTRTYTHTHHTTPSTPHSTNALLAVMRESVLFWSHHFLPLDLSVCHDWLPR